MRDQWIEWLQGKQRHFFYGVTLVVATFFIAFQAIGRMHAPPKAKFLAANQAFEKWLNLGEGFDKLERALAVHPELETKFGARVAERFIVQNEADKAEPFANRVLARVGKQSPGHAAFAEGSLLIAKGDLPEALKQSVSLKSELKEDSLLYGFNLVRIASLCRALHVQDQEAASLKDLSTYMEKNHDESLMLTECFHEGDITLTDYIAKRKSEVK